MSTLCVYVGNTYLVQGQEEIILYFLKFSVFDFCVCYERGVQYHFFHCPTFFWKIHSVLTVLQGHLCHKSVSMLSLSSPIHLFFCPCANTTWS